ncbi:MAG: hypothetical protein V1820_04305 [archaeon]
MSARRRKGLVYTTIAMIVFSIIVLAAVNQGLYLNAGEKRAISQISSDSIRSFVSTVERDYDKALDVASRRAIVVAVNYAMNATPMQDAETDLEELIMNGTLYGNPAVLMENSTISYWLSKMQEAGERAGLVVGLGFVDFSVDEANSFEISVVTTISLNVSSPAAETSVTRTLAKNFTVSLENFTDPYYSVRNSGLVTRVIRRSPYPSYPAFLVNGSYAVGTARGLSKFVSSSAGAGALPNKSGTVLVVSNGAVINSTLAPQFAGIIAEVNGTTLASAYVTGASNATLLIPNETYVYLDPASKSAWNRTTLDNLEETIGEGYYLSGSGPSFLDRLELRDTLTRTFGLESIASLPEISDKGIPVYTNTTTVDYLYFRNSSISGKSVRDIYYTWFRIDQPHEQFYGVTANNNKTLVN